jgi:hypothetical protein
VTKEATIRLEASNFHAAGVKLGARIIGIDRPGLGLSDFKPGFTVCQWPDEVWYHPGA